MIGTVSYLLLRKNKHKRVAFENLEAIEYELAYKMNDGNTIN